MTTKKVAKKRKSKPKTLCLRPDPRRCGRYFIAGDKSFHGATAYVRFINGRAKCVRWDGSEGGCDWAIEDAESFAKVKSIREVTQKEAHAEKRRLAKLAKTSKAETLAAASMVDGAVAADGEREVPASVSVPAMNARSLVPRARLPLWWLYRAMSLITKCALGTQTDLLYWATRGSYDTVTIKCTRTAVRDA